MKSVRVRQHGFLFFFVIPFCTVAVMLTALFFALRPIVSPLFAMAALLITGNDRNTDGEVLVAARDGDVWAWINNGGAANGDARDNTLPACYDKAVPLGSFTFPAYGDLFAYLKVEHTDVNCAVYMGDSKEMLAKGAGLYQGSHIPGDGGTSLIAGHCCTDFSTLGGCAVGDKIYLETNYGNFIYRVTGTAVALATDKTSYDLSAPYDNLILYTCYPFNTPFSVSQRYFVYAELLSGAMIVRP